MSKTRVCIRCTKRKAIGLFGSTPAGNLRAWCKDCHKAYKAAWKKTPKGRASEAADRARNGPARMRRYLEKDPERARAVARKAGKVYAKRHKEKINAKHRARRREHPEKYWAALLIRALVGLKILVRAPCEECGSPNAHGHHEDYTRPLEVRWLCASHHGKHHRATDGRRPEPLRGTRADEPLV